jgi:hypothetical protein
MTLNELLKKIPEGKRDYTLAVAKHDEGQLSAYTTVPVDKAHLGFDWTHEQIVLEPMVRLVTAPQEVHDANKEAVEYFSGRVTKAMGLAAEISRMIEDMPDAELKMKIRSKLAEI